MPTHARVVYHARTKAAVYQEVSDVERRLTELQSQVDRLSMSLHLWLEKQEQLPRVQDLRTMIEQERSSASSTTLSGFERTEARLAALETGVHGRLTELSAQIQAMVAEVRAVSRAGLPASAAPADAASWPLEDVVRLHSQLRGTGETSTLPQPVAPVDIPRSATGAPTADNPRLLAAAPAELLGRMEALERDLVGEQAKIRETAERGHATGRLSRAALIALMVGAVIVGFIVTRLQNQLRVAETRVSEAESLATSTAQTAVAQIEAARQEVDREIAEANAAALQAQTISDLLAAPDLVRYNLTGIDGSPLRGQTMFSRSRGLVFTGSRLPPPPAGSSYQLWLLTPGAAHSAGVFQPDAAGRFTLASDQPPTAPPPIVSASVTIEPQGGSPQPTGRTILAVPGR